MTQTKVPYGCWFFLAKGEYVDDIMEDGLIYIIDSLLDRRDTDYIYDIGSGIFVNVGRSLVFKTDYASKEVISTPTYDHYLYHFLCLLISTTHPTTVCDV